MNYQPSEVADLILMLALGPIIIIAIRRVMPRFPVSGAVAFAAMLGGYVFTIAEGFWLPDAFNLAEHLCYAIAGIAFVVMLIRLKGMLAGPGGPTS